MGTPETDVATGEARPALEHPPIFVVGHMRSGTTWVFDVLSAHDEVAGLFESRIFTGSGVGPLLRDMHWEHERHERMFSRRMALGQILTRDEVIADVRALCDEWFSRALSPGERFLVEKAPADATAVRAFAALYPEARVVHVLRDGRDVAISTAEGRRTWMRAPRATGEAPSERRMLWSIGRNWSSLVKGLRELAARDDGPPVHEVRYEDMHARPRETARALFDFCGIPAGDGALERILDETHFSKLEKTGPGSFRRSGLVGEWRGRWTAWDRLLFSAAAGETLHATGYAGPKSRRARVLHWVLMRYERLKRFM